MKRIYLFTSWLLIFVFAVPAWAVPTTTFPGNVTINGDLTVLGSGGGGGGLESTDIDTADEFAAIMTEVSGSGNFLRATSPTITTPTIAKLANLTSNGFVKTGSGDGTLSIDTSTYLASASIDTSAELRTILGDESGTGALIFASGNIGTATGTGLTLGSFDGGATAPLNIEVDGSGNGFVVAASATEYTRFISGGALKGMFGVGTVEFVIRNAGDIGFRSNAASSDDWKISGGNLVCGTDGGFNIGGAGAYPGTITAGTKLATRGKLGLGASSTLTIASGAITVTKAHHTVETETGAGSDDLDTISGGADGDFLILRAVNGAHTVTLKDGTGNLKLEGDCALDNAEDCIELISDGTSWYEVARSNNGT